MKIYKHKIVKGHEASSANINLKILSVFRKIKSDASRVLILSNFNRKFRGVIPGSIQIQSNRGKLNTLMVVSSSA